MLVTAMVRVAALIDRRDADGSVTISADELDALRTVFADHYRMRQRARALGVLNLLAEHRQAAGVPPVPDTQPRLPQEEK